MAKKKSSAEGAAEGDAPDATKSKKKPVMKDYNKLPKEDIDGLVAYMMTLKKG